MKADLFAFISPNLFKNPLKSNWDHQQNQFNLKAPNALPRCITSA
ncbi:hypothetical protein SAMN04488122_6404 [Chitinophaga arvensicola]|uniref:Uncharacterized protein n=1 Tax=Chitinophaga arvensicola TaxID=29529 RepID=A0A1I0SD17_9BACT|nr:hypothetical protein SAMN04488122_6404 [Chitinophaga arvensicola]